MNTRHVFMLVLTGFACAQQSNAMQKAEQKGAGAAEVKKSEEAAVVADRERSLQKLAKLFYDRAGKEIPAHMLSKGDFPGITSRELDLFDAVHVYASGAKLKPDRIPEDSVLVQHIPKILGEELADGTFSAEDKKFYSDLRKFMPTEETFFAGVKAGDLQAVKRYVTYRYQNPRVFSAVTNANIGRAALEYAQSDEIKKFLEAYVMENYSTMNLNALRP